MRAFRAVILILLCFGLPILFAAPGIASGICGPASEVILYKGDPVAKGEALVQFRDGVDEGARATLHASLGCRAVRTVAEGLERVQFTGKSLDEVLAAYNSDGRVAYAEPNHAYRFFGVPNDPNWPQQWGPQKINCAAAWDTYTGTDSVIIAMLDSGVMMNHPDLVGNLAYAKDNVWGGSNPTDLIGHGTHTSGTAAATTNNALGVAGVAHDCDFAMFKVGEFIFIFDDAVITSINDAIGLGHHVISMSFGGTAQSASMQSALNSASQAGIVCVASAGNDGTTAVNYPAGYASVISVASSTPSDTRSSFSNYGNWVDVAAPGENILSTYNDGGYTTMDGTSMACPHVSGMAGILYGLIGGARSQANADIIRDAIQDSAVDVGTWLKYGRVDLDAAMDLLSVTDPPVITAVTPGAVQAFMGGTMTVTGSHFTGTTSVQAGGTEVLDFTVVNDNTLTFEAPNAQALGPAEVTVTNPAGTSNGAGFIYIETDPPKLATAGSTPGGSNHSWYYGGGAGDGCLLLVGRNNATFPYGGFDILADLPIFYVQYLDAVGLGSRTVTVPHSAAGKTFYSQVITFDETTYAFVGASGIMNTIIF